MSQSLFVTKCPHVKVAPPPSPRSLGQQLDHNCYLAGRWYCPPVSRQLRTRKRLLNSSETGEPRTKETLLTCPPLKMRRASLPLERREENFCLVFPFILTLKGPFPLSLGHPLTLDNSTRLSSPESLPVQAPIQDTHADMCPASRLGHGNRPEGCILSCLDPSSAQTVSTVGL